MICHVHLSCFCQLLFFMPAVTVFTSMDLCAAVGVHQSDLTTVRLCEVQTFAKKRGCWYCLPGDFVFICVTYKGEVWGILAEQPGEDSLSLDTLLILEHIAIHEAIQHGGVGMDINVKLQTHPLS